MEGYVKLYRKITHWRWFDDNKTLKLFLFILTNANFEDREWGTVLIPKGSFITSYDILSRELKLSTQNIRTALNNLKLTNEITIKTTNKYTQINVVNWGLYQAQEYETNKQNNAQTNKPLTNKQQTTNNNLVIKELKELKEDKDLKKCITSNTKESFEQPKNNRFVVPTLEEVQEYCKERNNSIDAEAFIAFYDSKGWKIGQNTMKNWKSAIITWEKKDRQSVQKPSVNRNPMKDKTEQKYGIYL